MLREASLHARCAFWLFLEVEDEQRKGDTLAGFLLKPALPSPLTPTWTQPAERWCRPCLQAYLIRMLLDQNTAMSLSLHSSIAATDDARGKNRLSASSTSVERRRKL
ncbi:hypothetical protein Ptr902_08128 [Pyrenophora tritici-repentis]|nr:hypothetical protein Ptr902_08128 [Pyrenophora tritici-repentis]